MVERDARRIGDLARDTGLTVRALHHYDRLGLLTPSARTAGGHRCYTAGDVRRLHRIVALRSFGLSLDEIGAILDADPDQDPVDVVRRQVALVEERIRRATELRSRLLDVLDALGRLAEPSTTQFLRLIEETTTVNQPLTPEQIGELIEARRTGMAQLSDEEKADMNRRRAEGAAALSEEELARMAEKRRQLLPPGFAGG